MVDEDWLTDKKHPLNESHDAEYLYGYQIRAGNGHVYELKTCDIITKLLEKAEEKVASYPRHLQVFTPEEFRQEVKKDPRWKDFVTPRFG